MDGGRSDTGPSLDIAGTGYREDATGRGDQRVGYGDEERLRVGRGGSLQAARRERELTGEVREDRRGASGTLGVEARGHAARSWEVRHVLSAAEVQPYLDDLQQAEAGHELNNELPEHVALRTGSIAQAQRLMHMDAAAAAELQEHEGTEEETEVGGALGGHVGVGHDEDAVQIGGRISASGKFRMRTTGLGGHQLSVTLTEIRERGTELNASVSSGERSVAGSLTNSTEDTFAMTFVLDQTAGNFRQLYDALDDADSAADIRRFAAAHPELVRGQEAETETERGISLSAGGASLTFERRHSTTESFEIEEEEDEDREGDILITVSVRRGSSSGQTNGASVEGYGLELSEDEESSSTRAVTFRVSRNAPNFEQVRNQIHHLRTPRQLREYQHAHDGLVDNVELTQTSRIQSGMEVEAEHVTVGEQRDGTMTDTSSVRTVEGEDGRRRRQLTGRVRASGTRTLGASSGETAGVSVSDTGTVDLELDEEGEVEGSITRTQTERNIVDAVGRFAWDAWNHPGTVFRELFRGATQNGISATIKSAITGRMRDVVHAMGLRINTHDFNTIAERAHNRPRWQEAGVVAGDVGGFTGPWEECRRALLSPPVNSYEARIDRESALLLAKFRVIGRLTQRHGDRAATALMEVAYRWGAAEGRRTERVGTRVEWPDALRREHERYDAMIASATEIAGLYDSGRSGESTNRRYQNCQQQLQRLLRLFRQNQDEFEDANAYLAMTQALRDAESTLTEARDRAHERGSSGGSARAGGADANGGEAEQRPAGGGGGQDEGPSQGEGAGDAAAAADQRGATGLHVRHRAGHPVLGTAGRALRRVVRPRGLAPAPGLPRGARLRERLEGRTALRAPARARPQPVLGPADATTRAYRGSAVDQKAARISRCERDLR